MVGSLRTEIINAQICTKCNSYHVCQVAQLILDKHPGFIAITKCMYYTENPN